MKHADTMLRSGLGLFAARVASAGGSFVVAVCLARWLGPNDYGLLTLIITVVMIAGLPADAGVAVSTARFVREARDMPGRARAMATAGMLTKSAIVLVVAVALWMLASALGRGLEEPRLATLMPELIAVLIVSEGVRQLSKTAEGVGRLDRFAISQGVYAILLPVLVLGLVAAGAGVRGALLGRALALTVHVGLTAWLLLSLPALARGTGVLPPMAPMVGKVLRYGVPLSLATAGLYIYRRCDILMIQYFMGVEAVAFYGVQAPFITTAVMPVTVLAGVLGPTFADASEGRGERLRHALRVVMAAYAPVCVFLAIYAEPTVSLLLGDAYTPGTRVLQVYALGFLPFLSLSALLSIALNYLGFAALRAKTVLVSVVLNLLLNAILIPRMGIIGAAVSTLVTYTPVCLVYLRTVLRELHVSPRALVPVTARVVVAAAVMAASLYAVSLLLTGLPLLIVGGLAGVVIYGATAFYMGLLNREDWQTVTAAAKRGGLA